MKRIAVEKKHGVKHKKTIEKREELAKCFMDIKLSPRQFNKLIAEKCAACSMKSARKNVTIMDLVR